MSKFWDYMGQVADNRTERIEARQDGRSRRSASRNKRKENVRKARADKRRDVGVAKAETGSNLGGVLNTSITGERMTPMGGELEAEPYTAPPISDSSGGMPSWVLPVGGLLLVGALAMGMKGK